jgi:membrane protease YdiL (CAAX protease family)
MAGSFGVVAVAAGLGCLLLLVIVRRRGLWPRPGEWRATWNGPAVVAAFLGMIICPAFFVILLESIGFFTWLYGSEFPAGDNPQASHLRALWTQSLVAPIVFALIVIGFRSVFGTPARNLGLARQGLASSIVIGYGVWLVLAPICFAVFFLALALMSQQPDQHPLMDLGPWAGRREAVLFAVQAVILMPALEELVFRGVLLPWSVPLEGKTDAVLPVAARPHVVYGVAIVMTLQTTAMTETLSARDWARLPTAAAPLLFLIAIVPLYVVLPVMRGWRRQARLPSAGAGRAILSNGALFAAFHANVWPSPIPLFALGTGLAWLALRTRSIVPAFVVHALFNSVAVVYQQVSIG